MDTPEDAKVLQEGRVIIITSRREVGSLKKKENVEVVRLEPVGGDFDLRQVLEVLYEREVMHLMVEGGGYTLTGFLKAGLFDRVCVFQAPKFLGEGKGIGDLGIRKVSESLNLSLRSLKRLGEDVYLEYVKRR